MFQTHFEELLDMVFQDCIKYIVEFSKESEVYEFLVEELSKRIRHSVLTGEVSLSEAFQLMNYAGETLNALLKDKNSAF